MNILPHINVGTTAS